MPKKSASRREVLKKARAITAPTSGEHRGPRQKQPSRRIHWDQASVLVQLGLLDPGKLPVAGVETARKVLDPELPSNELMKRTLKDVEL